MNTYSLLNGDAEDKNSPDSLLFWRAYAIDTTDSRPSPVAIVNSESSETESEGIHAFPIGCAKGNVRSTGILLTSTVKGYFLCNLGMPTWDILYVQLSRIQWFSTIFGMPSLRMRRTGINPLLSPPLPPAPRIRGPSAGFPCPWCTGVCVSGRTRPHRGSHGHRRP